MANAKKKNVGYRKSVGPEFLLDNDVLPLPERKRIGAVKIYFPLDVMDVGRSFTTKRSLQTVQKAIRRYRGEAGDGRQFMVAVQADGRVRCWREK